MRWLRATGVAAAALLAAGAASACTERGEDVTCGLDRGVTPSAEPYPTPVPASVLPTPSAQPTPDADGEPGFRGAALDQALRYPGGELLGPLVWAHEMPEHEFSGVELSGGAVAMTPGRGTGFYRASDGTWIRAHDDSLPTFTSVGDLLLAWDTAANEVGGYDVDSGRLRWCATLEFPGPGQAERTAPTELVTLDGAPRRVVAVLPLARATHLASIDVPSGDLVWQRRVPGRWSRVDAGSGHLLLAGNENVRLHDWRSGEPRTEIAVDQPLAGFGADNVVVADRAARTLAAYDVAGNRLWTVDVKERSPRYRLTRAALLVKVGDWGPIGVYRLSDGERIASVDAIHDVNDAASSASVVYMPFPGVLAIDVRTGTQEQLPLPARGPSVFVAGDRLLLHTLLSDGELLLAFQLPQ